MEKIKMYFKYIIFVIVILILLIISIFLYYDAINKEDKKEDIIVEKKEKKEVKKEETKKEEVVDVKKYIYVDVKGAVNNPNVYMIEDDKRVIDAINIAGGLKEDSDISIINLSKKLKDEMCVIIYTKKEIEEYKKKNLSTNEIEEQLYKNIPKIDKNNDAEIKATSDSKNKENVVRGKISINTATIEELLNINGIGESKAKSIIEYRQANGPFSTIEDIKNVSGIGDALFEKIKDSITI